MGKVILGFMMHVRSRNLKQKADVLNKLRIGVKVFKGLAMNSLSQACLQLSEFTPSNQKQPHITSSKSDEPPPNFNLPLIPIMQVDPPDSVSEDDC